MASRVLKKQYVRPADLIHRWKIFRGDKVMVTEGPEKGKVGIIRDLLKDRNMVVVSDVNMKTRKQRNPETGEKVEVTREGPLHYSSVRLVHPKLGIPVKPAFRYDDEGNRVRVAKASPKRGLLHEEPLPIPPQPKRPLPPYRAELEKETPISVAEAVTLTEENALPAFPFFELGKRQPYIPRDMLTAWKLSKLQQRHPTAPHNERNPM
eukprot:CAMPEP_0196656334 /NCGR_PEP_ID=MMETSP1086-20130531/15486_1 /TAXON_ID=77921 /ORGANISM="Cyanoptyche  gloeocystis , Strain SAG4.97" /LENGTH=207 /DNA_ID=CAMNT_0041989043 /DNA_START=32 /DNA_END=655 /DNA_ORIENTATION=-